MTPIRTLVLLAGAEDARLFVNEGVGKGLTEIVALSATQFPETATEYADRPGRQSAAPGMGRHGLQPSTSVDDQQRDRFADRVIEALEQEWPQAGADRLVIAAPPKMLGRLRARLKGAPKAALMADIDKDLMHLAPKDLAPHLDGVLVV